MDLTLRTKEEIVECLEYLHQADHLEDVLPVLTVPENLILPFLQYRNNEPRTVGILPSTEDLSYARWSDEEVDRLYNLIHEGYSAAAIAVMLGRSPKAITNKAYKVLNISYINNTWTTRETA